MANPYTGKILAMAQTPYFNSQTPPKNSKNPIIYTPFTPGSSIKPLILAHALKKNYISPSEQIFCENGSWEKYDISDHYPLKKATLEDIIVNSSNIGMAKIGLQKIGTNNMRSLFSGIGFGKKSPYLEFPKRRNK